MEMIRKEKPFCGMIPARPWMSTDKAGLLDYWMKTLRFSVYLLAGRRRLNDRSALFDRWVAQATGRNGQARLPGNYDLKAASRWG
jgi:hypothetical protein